MKRILSLILSVIIGVNFCLLPALSLSISAEEPESYIPAPVDLKSRSDFGFGINTHPKSYAAYPEVYLEQQIHAVARAGCEWIRFGGGIPDDGDWSYLDTTVGLCNKYGLRIIMVLQPAISFGLDYITLSCQTMAYRYNGKDGRGYVDCFQIWNEVDSELMRDKYGGSAPDGVSENCYFTISVDGAKDLPEYLEYYTAAEKGIHSKDCSSKFMVNFASTHCGMITYFLRNGLKIDMVGWDLYATKKDREESAQNFIGIYDTVEEKLYDPYKVPVILCETNVDSRTLSTEERNESKLESSQRLIDNVYLAYQRPWIKGAIFYELLNQPTHGSSPEAWYGLLENPSGGIGVTSTSYEKPIYKEIQRLIGGNPNLPMIKRSQVDLKPYEKLVVDTADDSSLANVTGDIDDMFALDDFEFDDDAGIEDIDDLEEGSVADQVKVAVSKLKVYELPWIAIICEGAGLLVAAAAIIVIHILRSKKKAQK